MKHTLMGLAVFTANLLIAQSSAIDTLENNLIEEIILNGDFNKAEIEDQNVLIPIELVLKGLNGTDIVSRGNFAQDPVIRGYRASQINVNLNGMRMFGACTDRMDPITSYAETNNLKEIKTSKGSETNCHANAHGGTVDLELKSSAFSENISFSGKAGGAYASNTSGINGFINLEHRAKRLGVYTQFSKRQHLNYHAGGGEEIIYSQYEKVNFTLDMSYKLSKRELLRVNVLYDKAENVGYPALPMDVGLALGRSISARYENYKTNNIIKNYKIQAYYNTIYHEMDDSQRPNLIVRMDMPGWSNTFGSWIKTEFQKMGNHHFNGMLEYYQNFRKAEMTMYFPDERPMYMLTWPDVMQHTIGIGLTDQWKVSETSTLNISSRLDYQKNNLLSDLGKRQLEIFGYDVEQPFNFWNFSFKTNYKLALNCHTNWLLNVSYSERTPDISELFGFYLFNAHDGYDYIGNVDNKKEQAAQIETGFSTRLNKWNINGMVYFHHIKNYILGVTDSTLSAMTIGANGVRIYTNLDYAQFSGFELNATYQPHKVWETGLNATYTYAIDYAGDYMPLIPPLKGKLWLSYSPKTWYTKLELLAAADQDKVNENFGDIPTPGYGIINISLRKYFTLNKVNLSLELSIENILDTYYRDHLNWGQIPMLGRNIITRVIFDF